MSNLAARLDEFRLDVQLNLTLSGFADNDLDVVNDDGQRPVVVALDEERLPVLMRRVQNAGGYANVFVKGEGRVRAVSIIDASGALDPDSAESHVDPSDRPDPRSTVGMFLDYLALRPDGVRLPAALGDDETPQLVRQPRDVEFA